MRDLRISSRPMISSILENTEIATQILRRRMNNSNDQNEIGQLNKKIKDNEELAEALRDILKS